MFGECFRCCLAGGSIPFPFPRLSPAFFGQTLDKTTVPSAPTVRRWCDEIIWASKSVRVLPPGAMLNTDPIIVAINESFAVSCPCRDLLDSHNNGTVVSRAAAVVDPPVGDELKASGLFRRSKELTSHIRIWETNNNNKRDI